MHGMVTCRKQDKRREIFRRGPFHTYFGDNVSALKLSVIMKTTSVIVNGLLYPLLVN